MTIFHRFTLWEFKVAYLKGKSSNSMGPFLYVQLPEADFMGIDRVLLGIAFFVMGISW
jgi:hypothetical protein